MSTWSGRELDFLNQSSKRLREGVHRIDPELIPDRYILQKDNMHPQTELPAVEFSEKKSIAALEYPSYDISFHVTFYLFPRKKNRLSRSNFEMVE
jgi:hypothetical protein